MHTAFFIISKDFDLNLKIFSLFAAVLYFEVQEVQVIFDKKAIGILVSRTSTLYQKNAFLPRLPKGILRTPNKGKGYQDHGSSIQTADNYTKKV